MTKCPIEWCREMRDAAEDKSTASIYQQLADMWAAREEVKGVSAWLKAPQA